jgi:glucuronate isomerase
MKKFMDKDFLLEGKWARRLYHGHAASLPIIDYHCHLDPKDVAENRRFADLAEVWLGGDHYKWRTMRADGVPEDYITGKAAPYEKFLAWAKTIPHLAGNPLYHWTHLELRRYFGIDEPLDAASAPSIWKRANAALREDANSAHGILARFRVEFIGTTDDPADSLEWHAAVKAKGGTGTAVRPSFRPDPALSVEAAGFKDYAARLGRAAGVEIRDFESLALALEERMDYFDAAGCRASDHAFDLLPCAWDPAAADAALSDALAGRTPDPRGAEAHKTKLLRRLSAGYGKRGWIMQLHAGCQRNVNSAALASLGPNTGYDASMDEPLARRLAALLEGLSRESALPRTVVYSLNPADYQAIGTVMGCFQGGGRAGLLQLGSAWWFCDHLDGMEEQMRVLASIGSLYRFIGMLTDSRSFLSYPRHEYFRRILCRLVGRWADSGELPADEGFLSGMVKRISYENAREYLGLDTPGARS